MYTAGRHAPGEHPWPCRHFVAEAAGAGCGAGAGFRARGIAPPGKAELTARVGLAWGTEALGASGAGRCVGRCCERDGSTHALRGGGARRSSCGGWVRVQLGAGLRPGSVSEGGRAWLTCVRADCRDVVGLMMQNLESFRVADWRDVVGCRLEYFRQRDVVPTLFAPVQVAEIPVGRITT